MKNILVATRSAGKLRELRPLLEAHGYAAIDLLEAGVPETPDEDRLEVFDTFEENAIAKARYFRERTGLPTLADDSGLAVSALSATADRAMTLLPILLIPQVLFTFPAVQMDMKGPAGVIARAMPTWWSFDLLRRVALAPYEAMDDDTLDARIKADEAVLMTRRRVESMLGAGYLILQHRGVIETTWTASLPEALGRRLPARLGYWGPAAADGLVLAGMGAALLLTAARGQRRWDAQR